MRIEGSVARAPTSPVRLAVDSGRVLDMRRFSSPSSSSHTAPSSPATYCELPRDGGVAVDHLAETSVSSAVLGRFRLDRRARTVLRSTPASVWPNSPVLGSAGDARPPSPDEKSESGALAEVNDSCDGVGELGPPRRARRGLRAGSAGKVDVAELVDDDRVISAMSVSVRWVGSSSLLGGTGGPDVDSRGEMRVVLDGNGADVVIGEGFLAPTRAKDELMGSVGDDCARVVGGG